MSTSPHVGGDAALPVAVVDLLGRDHMWADPPGEEDGVVAAVLTRAAVDPTTTALRLHRPTSRWQAALAGAAAVLALLAVLVVADVLPLRAAGPTWPEGVVVALAPTAAGPAGASAAMELQDLPDGLRIELDVRGLPPAPADGYYEAFLQPPDGDPVSAGSFHLRGGGDRVVLWAGIGVQEDLAVTITAQPGGRVLLVGAVGG